MNSRKDLTPERKKQIDDCVNLVIREYGACLVMLGAEGEITWEEAERRHRVWLRENPTKGLHK